MAEDEDLDDVLDGIEDSPTALAARPAGPAGLGRLPREETQRIIEYLGAAGRTTNIEEIPQGLIQWQEGTDMRSALTSRWQTFQGVFLEKGQERLDDDAIMEWFEEQLDWWLVEADSASAGSGHTKPFEIIHGLQDYVTQARQLGFDEVEAKYGYVSLVNNRLGIGWHVEPSKNIRETMQIPRELLKSLHYVDVARIVDDYIEQHGDQLTMIDVAAMMAEQSRSQDRDVIAVIDASDDNEYGNVGIGKSDVFLQLAPLVDPTFDMRFDVAYSVDAVRFDRLMRVALGKKFAKGKVWAHDEAENVLYKRESMHGKNKNRVKRFMRVRKRNQVIFLCANSIWNLDELMREDRVTWRLRLPDRGECEVYRTAGRKFVNEDDDKWGKDVTDFSTPSLREVRPDVRRLYESLVDVVDTAASKLEEDKEDAELEVSPLDELLKKNSRWGLDMLEQPYRGIINLQPSSPVEVRAGDKEN